MAARDSLTCRCEGKGSSSRRRQPKAYRDPARSVAVASWRHNLRVLLLLSVLLFGCRPATPPPAPADQTPAVSLLASEATSMPATPTRVPEEVMEIRNGEYQLGATDALEIVHLTDGDFQQGTRGNDNYLAITMTDFAAVGDLNADGAEEIAVLVAENYGGTGTFVFLAVYANVDGAWTFQTSTMVDDRPRLHALAIEQGEIFLEATIHGPEEEMCCPTLRTTRHYRFEDNVLDRTDYTTFTPDGRPRTLTIEAPANGSEVFSSISLKGKVAIAPFENNLTYRIYDVGGVELAIGAISVTASEAGGPGSFEALIPLGRVLSDAVIRVEVQDLSAADGSLLAMDSIELVVK